jgi:hypothetical protein
MQFAMANLTYTSTDTELVGTAGDDTIKVAAPAGHDGAIDGGDGWDVVAPTVEFALEIEGWPAIPLDNIAFSNVEELDAVGVQLSLSQLMEFSKIFGVRTYLTGVGGVLDGAGKDFYINYLVLRN